MATLKPQLAADFDLGRLFEALSPRVERELRVRVRRPDDLLVLDLVFENLVLNTEGEPLLVRKEPNRPGILVAQFPPQSFGEQAFLEVSSGGETPPSTLPSARVRMAGPSRLAFLMPSGSTSLPFTLDAVLDAMRTWDPRLALSAQPDPSDLGRQRATPVSKVSRATTDHLIASLTRHVGPGVAPAIGDAAQRIAERAAGGLTGGAQQVLGAVVLSAMQGELDELRERFPALREAAPHQAVVASLALAASERLGAAVGPGMTVDLLPALPYLPLLLRPQEPHRHVTALEVPYRLLLSPIENARWAHRTQPVVAHQRTELWHTRLTTGADTGPDLPSKVRAIWSPDYPLSKEQVVAASSPPNPFRMSLDPLDRQMLVKNMAGYDEHEPGGRAFKPRSSRARRLHLSSLGALLDAEGTWPRRPDLVDLEEWRHLASVGRDAYVRVVYAGYLCCFGHAASLVKVTERKFQGPANQRVAILRQRFFVVVRERIKSYEPGGHTYGGRNFPVTQVEILTRVTPSLHDPGIGPSKLNGFDYQALGVIPRRVFWPMIETPGGTPGNFLFDVVATDIDGKQVTFSIPLLFVSEVVNRDTSPTKGIKKVKDLYNAEKPWPRRSAAFGGATVCFAPPDPADAGDTRLPTQSMGFRAGDLTRHHISPPAPNYYPETESAEVGIAAVQKLLARPGAVTPVTYPQLYKDDGFLGANAGKLFLQAYGSAHRLDFGNHPGAAKSDALGALAAPQMAILGLSRATGPVGGQLPADLGDPTKVATALADAAANKFNPAKFFDGAKILGGIKLSDILSTVTGLAGVDVPKLVARDFPDRVEASFDWATVIKKSDPLQLIVPSADGVGPTNLEMHGRVTTPLTDPAAATYEATAVLTNFKVNLFGFIVIWFDRLSFLAQKGQKPDVAVQLDETAPVRFGGPLEFVNTLRELIPSNGFSDPPALTVTPSGITAGYSLTLPTIGLGVFSLSNASLGASFVLPFDARPASVRFNFSERQSPFSLTVSAIGGGGFFALAISAQGVQEIEAALEFGAAISINLGVASGTVEIKAGIYFHWIGPASGKGSVELAGYVRLHGELSVLGIISVSLTFNLQLAYKKEGGKSTVWGEATLSVEIEVLFFSASVSVKCRREFGGAPEDPKFLDLIPDESTWAEYCDAFAEEVL